MSLFFDAHCASSYTTTTTTTTTSFASYSQLPATTTPTTTTMSLTAPPEAIYDDVDSAFTELQEHAKEHGYAFF
jgi:hypothetical protein